MISTAAISHLQFPMLGFGRSDAGMLRTAWELSAGMLSFVVAIAIGWAIGRWLDGVAGTRPWLTVVFSALGFVAGVLNVYRTLTRALNEPPAGN
jgi:ATP synthase protein I